MSFNTTLLEYFHLIMLVLVLAGRVLKKPKLGDGQRLQEEAIQLLEQHQDLSSLFKEAGVSRELNKAVLL